MTMLVDDEPLEYAVIHRHLADPIYRIRKWGLMLTDTDLFICFVVSFSIWGLIVAVGIGQWSPVGSPLWTLDPLGFLFTLAGMLWGISVLHVARPEAGLGTLLRGGGMPQAFAPTKPDHKWRSSVGRRGQWI